MCMFTVPVEARRKGPDAKGVELYIIVNNYQVLRSETRSYERAAFVSQSQHTASKHIFVFLIQNYRPIRLSTANSQKGIY